MADEHHRRTPSSDSASHRNDPRFRDEAGFDEDPLVELARIVSDEGGFYPGTRSPGKQDHRQGAERHPTDPFAAELEAELMQEVELHRQHSPGESHARGQGPDADPDAAQGWDRHAPDPEGAFEPLHQAAPMSEDTPTHERPEDAAYALGGAAHAAEPDEPDELHWQEDHSRPDPQYLAESPEPFVEDRVAAPDGGEHDTFHFDHGDLNPQDEQSYGSEHDGYGAYSDTLSEDRSEDLSEYPAAEMRRAGGGRSRKGLLAAAGVLCFVVLGGAGAAWIGMSGTPDSVGPPPVISADAGPLKTVPEPDTSGAQNGVGEAVYDRVAGEAVKAEERLVDRTETPQDIARPVGPETPGSAVQLERRPGFEPDGAAAAGSDDAPADAGEDRIAARISAEDVAATEAPTLDPIGPRRVRTITVRPDGTIVPEAARSAEPAAREPIQLAAPQDEAQAPTPVPVRTLDFGPRAGEPEGADAASERVAVAPMERILEPSAEAAEPVPRLPREETRSGVLESEPAVEEPAEELVVALPRPRPESVPQPAAADAPSAPAAQPAAAQPAQPRTAAGAGPVNLLAAAPRPAQPASPPPQPSAQGGYAVQISAQRTEDQARASFATLRSQYASVLGGREAQIERADLGDRGIYYRVRIGTDSQAEAVQLCEQLRAAGGNCFVSR